MRNIKAKICILIMQNGLGTNNICSYFGLYEYQNIISKGLTTKFKLFIRFQ